ncbi:MAG: GAF domain-containing protein, partial [Hassallia sp.]
LKETQGGRYRNNEAFVVNDIYQVGHSPCHLDILEQFEAKAYIAETLEQLQRQSREVALTAERDRAVAKIIDKIRQSPDIEGIFTTSTKEVRSLLNTDRVAVYRFNPDWSGEFVSESVTTGWSNLVEKQYKIQRLQETVSNCNAMQTLIQSSKLQPNNKAIADTYLQETQGGRFRHKQTYAVADIYKAGFSTCYIEVLEEYEAKAYAIVPIFQGQKLWGMLYQFFMKLR